MSDVVYQSIVSYFEREVMRLEVENAKFRAALEWYADPVNWHNRQGMIQDMNILGDGGIRARAALINEWEGK